MGLAKKRLPNCFLPVPVTCTCLVSAKRANATLRPAGSFAASRWCRTSLACMRCHVGSCIRGIATQKPELVDRLNIEQTAEQVASFLEGMATELAAITLACGKRDVHELDRGDLIALSPQAAEITGLPLTAAVTQEA